MKGGFQGVSSQKQPVSFLVLAKLDEINITGVC